MTESEVSRLPSPDVSKSQWRQSGGDPNTWKREPLPLESANMSGHLFLGGTFSIKGRRESPEPALTTERLEAVLTAAWKGVYSQNPQMSCTVVLDAENRASIQYRHPQGEDEVQNWVDCSFKYVTGGGQTCWDLQDELCEGLKHGNLDPVGGPAAMIHFLVGKSDKLDSFDRLQFLLHVSHTHYDAAGMMYLGRMYFETLAAELGVLFDRGSVSKVAYNLPFQPDKLAPPYTSIMNEQQLTSGVALERAAQADCDEYEKGVRENPSIGPRPEGAPWGPSRGVRYDFSREESVEILRAVKEKLGPSYTITYLLHAVVVVAMLQVAPLPPVAAAEIPRRDFLSMTVVNGRRFLLPEIEKSRTYPCVCVTLGTIPFFDLDSYSLSPSADDSDTRHLLIRGSHAAKKGYDSIFSRTSFLSESSLALEAFVPIYMTADVKPSFPYYMSEGIFERRIDREYYFSPSEKESGGGCISLGEDLQFFNCEQGPRPCVRLSSWRDRINLSVEYTETYFDKDYMQRYLDTMERLVRVFAELLPPKEDCSW